MNFLFPRSSSASPLPPLLAASQSNESQEESYDYIRVVRAPQTPEGLRSRTTPSAVREFLGLVEDKDVDHPSPLRSFRATTWSQPITSPQISNNSFYDHYQGVAESPDLNQAKTAVGALVADLANQSFSSLSTRTSVRPYLPLEDEDLVEQSRTPMRTRKYKPTLPATPESAVFPPSPSSLARPYQLQRTNNFPSAPSPNQSYSSREHLMVEEKQHKAYDFEPLVDDVHIEEQTLVSGMSNDKDLFPMNMVSSPKDSGLRLRKEFNQRRYIESLIYSAVERLQDELSLVHQVENNAAAALSNWFLRTPLDQEGLLTGFSRKSRDILCQNIQSLTHEIESSISEEYFLTSPTNEYVVEHTDLKDALQFCRNLIRMAILESNNESKWKCSIRQAVVYTPASPHQGGDTSVFSLPETAETPMTSNVSVGNSTITSQQNIKTAPDGEQVRRGIEMLSTLLERMSIACRGLVALGVDAWRSGNADIQASVRFTEDIKRVYFQLLGLNIADMKALIDSFVLDGMSQVIARQVTDDEQDQPILPPPGVRNSLIELDDTATNLFSPGTEDMKTWNEVVSDDEQEDLRRTMGSIDYDDHIEVRQAPERSPFVLRRAAVRE